MTNLIIRVKVSLSELTFLKLKKKIKLSFLIKSKS